MITLSICCITYNHEKFIAKAIESFLEQKVIFDFEIIISDDASGDKTNEIVEQFQKSYPNKIKYYRQEKNIGMLPNFQLALEACSGKYIALCEGDDYWIDKNKLQKQVDFLEANPDYSTCFHRVYLLEEGKELILSDLNKSDKEETYTIKDLAQQNIIHTPSVVFRNGLIKQFPAWFSKSPVGDYVLHLLNAKHGLIKYFPHPMAVYRMNSGGWSGQQRQVMRRKWITVLSFLLTEDFEEEVSSFIKDNWRKEVDEYLRILFPRDLDQFTEALKMYAKEDKDVAYYWATKAYPEYLKSILNSRFYKLAKKASGIRRKWMQ